MNESLVSSFFSGLLPDYKSTVLQCTVSGFKAMIEAKYGTEKYIST